MAPACGSASTDSYAYAVAANRLTEISNPAGASRSYGYDAAGNTTAETRVAGVTETWAYSYDKAGRLVTAKVNGATEGQYAYNALGQQVWRTAWGGGPAAVTLSVHDLNGNRIAEHDGAGAVIREYIWLDGRPLAVIEGGQTFWLSWDQIGRPVMATDATGAVVWAARYRPFGGIDEVSVDTGVLEQTLRFPGQWFEAETGLHQNWMRDYDPTTGRYLEADPLGLVDGASVYGYAGQSPLRFTDPSGQNTIVAGAGAGAAIGGPHGAVAGAIIGTILGVGYLGYELYQYCASENAEEEIDCEKLLRDDTDTCNAVTRRRGKAAGARCHKTATDRYAQCLREGRVTIPLDVWNN